jgi:hypothetical protein
MSLTARERFPLKVSKDAEYIRIGANYPKYMGNPNDKH